MSNTLSPLQGLEDMLASMSLNEPTGFDRLSPGDILSDDAQPTLNMWRITFDNC